MQIKSVNVLVILFTGLFLVNESKAQDLDPRFLSALPIGGNFAVASYGYSIGNILLDNSLPIKDLQRNSSYGAAFAYRINKNHALKIACTSGISTRFGADFNTILLAYQFMWFDFFCNFARHNLNMNN